MDYEDCIGMYFGEPGLGDCLATLGLIVPPSLALKRGEDTVYLSSRERGIELSFVPAESLERRRRDYPEGALVLVNMRFYGGTAGAFKRFAGSLPQGLAFGLSRQALAEALGKPDWAGLGDKKQRWEGAQAWLLVSYDLNGDAEVVSLNYPSL